MNGKSFAPDLTSSTAPLVHTVLKYTRGVGAELIQCRVTGMNEWFFTIHRHLVGYIESNTCTQLVFAKL